MSPMIMKGVFNWLATFFSWAELSFELAWTSKVISIKVNFKISTSPLDDRSNYRSRVGEKLWFRWDPYWLPPFGDLLCSLPASDGDPYIADGESSVRRFHTDSSTESSRCPYLLWTWTWSFIIFRIPVEDLWSVDF